MSTQQYNNTYCQPQYFTEDYYSSVPSSSLPQQPPQAPLPLPQQQQVIGPTFPSEPFHYNQLNHVPVFLPPPIDCQETTFTTSPSWGPLPMFDVNQPPPSFSPAAGVASSSFFQSNDDDVTQFVNQFENIDWGDQKLVSTTTTSSPSTTSIPVETLKLKQPPLRQRKQPPLLRPKKPQQPAAAAAAAVTTTTTLQHQEINCNATGTKGSGSNVYEMACNTIFNQEKNYDFKWEHNVQQMSSILNQQNVNQTLDITSALSVLFNCISNQREDIKSLRTAFCSLKKKLDNKNSNSLFEIKKNDAAAAFLNSVPTSTTKIAKRQRPSHSLTTKRRCPVFNVNQDTLNNVSTPAVVPLAPKKKKQYPKK
jgi:hypothetical protein